MTVTATRTQAKQLIDFVPDDKITFIFHYIQSFASSKTAEPAVNFQKKAAYEALLADVTPVPKKTLSLNGQDEIADIIMRKSFYLQ